MIRRWLPSSSTKRRISDFLKHRKSLHDTAARQQLTVNCSSRGYARMIEAHADPRSEALCRRPEARRWSSEHRRNETRERVERRTREMQNRTVRRASGGAARTCVRARPALRRTVAPDRPATAFRLAAHDHRNKRMILWKYYICLRQCRSTALTLRTRPLTCHTLNTQHFTDWTDNTPQCACAAPRPPMHEPLPVPPSPTVSSARVRARLHAPAPWRPGAEALALHNEAQGQGHNAHGTRLTRALWNSVP